MAHMTLLRLLISLLCVWPIVASANAPIYKYVDPYGNVTYSNVPVPGAKRSTLPPVPVNPYVSPSAVLSNRDGKSSAAPRAALSGAPASPNPASAARASSSPASSAPTPGAYPVIDGATQRNRDANRARILQDELDNEQRALNNARRILQETQRYAKPDSDLLRGLRDTVQEREKNIAALQREIGRR